MHSTKYSSDKEKALGETAQMTPKQYPTNGTDVPSIKVGRKPHMTKTKS